MDDNIINNVGEYIIKKIQDEYFHDKMNTVMAHNHPPIRFEVIGCPYCEKFGNYFKKH
tara:strand:+ start:140 stop:313 length:174 start_codon:yes stop_codon:yes gene_type:complete